jgi:hypothetical protein
VTGADEDIVAIAAKRLRRFDHYIWLYADDRVGDGDEVPVAAGRLKMRCGRNGTSPSSRTSSKQFWLLRRWGSQGVDLLLILRMRW